MLPLMMDLCKACAKARSLKAKLALRERMVAIRHQLMAEGIAEYQAEISAEIDVDSASDDYFDLKGFLLECERSCFECSNSDEAKVYLVVKEYLELCYSDGNDPPAKKSTSVTDATSKQPVEKMELAKKAPTSLTDFRRAKERREFWNDK